MPDMNLYERLRRAFEIFQKYDLVIQSISAEHDIIYTGPGPSNVSEEDVEELERLGWSARPVLGCFSYET